METKETKKLKINKNIIFNRYIRLLKTMTFFVLNTWLGFLFLAWITTSMQCSMENITQWFYWGVLEAHVAIGLKVRLVCWLIKADIPLSLNHLVVPLAAWAISISGCRYLCCWFTFYVKSLLNLWWRCFV